LTFEGTITLVSGTTTYALPTAPKFCSMLAPAVDRSLFRWLGGPQNSIDYQTAKGQIGLYDPPFAIRTKLADRTLREIVFASDPARAGTVAFDYLTDEWAFDGASYTSVIASDGAQPLYDRVLFTQGVRWRLLRAIGRAYLDEREDYERRRDVMLGRENGEILTITHRPASSNVPDGYWSGTVGLDGNGLPL
jgi:hypothetical protein